MRQLSGEDQQKGHQKGVCPQLNFWRDEAVPHPDPELPGGPHTNPGRVDNRLIPARMDGVAHLAAV